IGLTSIVGISRIVTWRRRRKEYYGMPGWVAGQSNPILMDKEYVFKSDKGYRVYDRFMELWLQALPYGNL
ncbi:hypothetical protein, partial [uncultured Butyricimonas sp.]|uniref:hypothetical protein n=1 Tax=uncultured Butyricimonas sp. TaxID=1268785 RepID=UPI0034C6C5B9